MTNKKTSHVLQFIVLAAVFLLHQMGVAFANQPLFTFLRTVLSECELPVVTWLFPVGGILSFLFAKRFEPGITRQIPLSFIASEVVIAASYLALYGHASTLDKNSTTYLDLVAIAALSFTLGFAQALSWTILVTTTLRTLPMHYHKIRAVASTGWLLAGLSLTQVPNETGLTLLIAFGMILFAIMPALAINRGVVTTRIPGNAFGGPSQNPSRLLLVVVGMLAAVEVRYGINAQTYVSQSLGRQGNTLLMIPIAIEIALLLTIAGKAKNCAKTNRWLILLGPASWVVVIGALSLYKFLGVTSLLAIGFLSCNVVFQTAVAFRLPQTLKGQSSAALAQAVGGIAAYALTIADANIGIAMEDSWLSTLLLALTATALAAFALFRERALETIVRDEVHPPSSKANQVLQNPSQYY